MGSLFPHPDLVTPQFLRCSLRSWIRRPIGRVFLLLLMGALVSAGIPGGLTHAHPGTGHHHDHLGAGADYPATPAHPDGPESTEGTVLHSHALTTAAVSSHSSTSPLPYATTIVRLVPATSVDPPASAVYRPLYRPPIA